MRIKTFTKGGYIDGGFTSGGGTMTGPLVLFGDPTKELEAATKQYVDTKTAAFSADKFTSGTLQAGRLPALGGDVVSTTGSNNISLKNSGVSAGVFTKVTVNAQGLITAGGSLTEADIPALDWSKISTGKPTTLAGYGITDALSKAGGTVSGALTLHADPTSANHLATKQYVDNTSGGASALKTGDIISKMVSTTPTGFLRCNGGQVNKTTYAALYTAIGDTFSGSNMTQGNGKPWQSQYDINLEQTLNLGAMTLNGSTLYTTHSSGYFVTKNYLYMTGGYVNGGQGHAGSNFASSCSRAPINADGTLGPWEGVTFLPSGLFSHQVIVAGNTVYLIGGSQYSNGNALFQASINADGSIGEWVTVTSNIPAGQREFSQAVLTKDRIYLVGGSYGGGYHATTLVASVYSGSISSFTDAGFNLPVALTQGHLIATKNRLYFIGGFNGVGVNTVYTTTLDGNGAISGPWTATTAFPVTVYGGSSFVTRNAAYIIGGTGATTQIYGAPINADGTLGTWSLVGSIPVAKVQTGVVAVNNKLYLLNGGFSTSYSSDIYSCALKGSFNDYSSYYNGTIIPTNVNNFRLPDLTTSDLVGSYSYIKF